MGLAVGCIGLSHDTFCRLTPEELSAIIEAWNKERESQERDKWERMRLLAAISIQPHVSRKVTPQQLVPLPWDEEKPHEQRTKTLTAEEHRQRMEEIERRIRAHGHQERKR